jgi:NAD(P)-dependent dehydrogenase (short-subunit alcohol dehydrogenase family)
MVIVTYTIFSDEYTQNLFNVNVFGPVRVAQAILPLFRQQGSGFIAFIGAGLSWGGIPFLNFYSAAKAALNAFVEGFRNETRNQPIQCTILEPGGFNSELGKARAGSNEGFGAYQPVIEPYVELWNEVLGVFVNEITPNVPGEIEKFAKTILELLGDEETRRKLPVRVILGSDAVGVVKQKCEEQLSLLEEYKDVSKRTDKDGAENLDYSGTVNLTSILR